MKTTNTMKHFIPSLSGIKWSFLLLLFSLLSTGVLGQKQMHFYNGDWKNLLGSWTGFALNEYGEQNYLEMVVDTIYPDNTVSGTFYAEFENDYDRSDPYYAYTAFSGSVRQHKKALYFIFSETYIINEYHRGGWAWCLNGGRLNVKISYGSALRMYGKDETIDGECGPGFVQLIKWIPVEKKEKPEQEPARSTKKPSVIAQNPVVPPEKHPSPKVMVNKSLAAVPQDSVRMKPAKTQPDWEKVTKQEIEKYQEQVGDINVAFDEIIEIRSDSLILEVWDEFVVDGDTISLFMNGKWILRNHGINQHKKVMILKDLRDENTIILHAENMGRQRPNTAAITIFDGYTRHKLTLSSEEAKSGAIKLKKR